MKIINHIKHYGFPSLRKLLFEYVKTHGNTKYVGIKPSFKCNQHCSYCIVEKTLGKKPRFKEMLWSDWLPIIEAEKPKMITISGGEPMIYPGIVNLVNELVRRKYLVLILTNLSSRKGLKIKRSWRVVLNATYHKEYSLDRFLQNRQLYRKKFFVKTIEIGTFKAIPDSESRPLVDKQLCNWCVRYSPDGRKFICDVDLEKAGI